jgi:phenylacetate-CoA ligase
LNRWGHSRILLGKRDLMKTVDAATMTQIAETKTTLGLQKAFELFHAMAKRVPAYKEFLKDAGVNPADIRLPSDFHLVPPVDKANYFLKYRNQPQLLCWDGTLDGAVSFSVTSGSTGNPYFYPTGMVAEEASVSLVEYVLKRLGLPKQRTLLVNTFTMGTWMAGTAFDNWSRTLAKRWGTLHVVSPGINKVEALRSIQWLWGSGQFDQLVICGYPAMVKELMIQGQAGYKDPDTGEQIIQPIDWSRLPMATLHGGDAFPEGFRDTLLRLMGLDAADGRNWGRVTNFYAASEMGLLAPETPISLALRRHLVASDGQLGGLLPGNERQPSVQQFDPELRWFDELPKEGGGSELLLTANNIMPLCRYNTHDTGHVLSYSAVADLAESLVTKHQINGPLEPWPTVMVYGRRGVALYAANLPEEHFREIAEDARWQATLTGLCVPSVDYDTQQLHILFQLRPNVKLTASQAGDMTAWVHQRLQHLSTEYRELVKMNPALFPTCEYAPHNDPRFAPGVKPKVTKR